MRLFLAGLLTETNSFAPCPAGRGAFEAQGIRHDATSKADPLGMLPAIEAVRRTASKAGFDVEEGLFAGAMSMGPIVQSVFEGLRDELLSDLEKAGAVDAVVLLLHGSMIAEQCDDCEGDLIERVRAIVGPNVPIGVALDLHCHLTGRMLRFADLLIAYKEYPHTDIAECAARTTELTIGAARGAFRPTMAAHDCRMIGLWSTVGEPMRGYVEKMRALEREPGILSVSLAHGMSYGDMPEAGAKAWVVTDNDAPRAAGLARDLAHELFAIRDPIATRMTSLPDALDRLENWQGEKPLALADTADNPGGGAFGDSTFILSALLERRIGGVALGNLWDPGAVQICHDAGVGATFAMRLGGKTGPASGDPVDVRATVMALATDHSQDDFGTRSPLGPAAWVRTESGIDIVLTSRVQQVLGIDLFTGLGVPIADLRGIVVKSMQHFLESFGPFIGDAIHVDTPGLMRADFENIPFQRRGLNYWPRVADPFADERG